MSFLPLGRVVVAGRRQEVEGCEPAHQGGPVLQASEWRPVKFIRVSLVDLSLSKCCSFVTRLRLIRHGGLISIRN